MDITYFEKNAAPLERQIKEEFGRKIWEYAKWESTNSSWTKAIKEILAEIGHQKALLVATSSIGKSDWKEWLYDFVLYEYDDESLKDIHLVVECEWGNYSNNWCYFQSDFEKLMSARARYRLMIFEGKSESEIENTVKDLNKYIDGFKLSQNGDRYMYVVWNKEKQEFIFDLKIYGKN